MGRTSVILLVILGLMSACEHNDIGPAELKNGTYAGIFYRTSPTADGMVSHVTLTLENGTYTGQSDIPRYPAICRGSYVISDQNIEFTNECPWTAEFDWTFILSGTYTISRSDNQIILKRVYNDDTFDTYELTRQ